MVYSSLIPTFQAHFEPGHKKPKGVVKRSLRTEGAVRDGWTAAEWFTKLVHLGLAHAGTPCVRALLKGICQLNR